MSSAPDIDLARLKALFGAVCDLPEAGQAAMLQQLAATPAELERVQALLREDAISRRLTLPVSAMLGRVLQEFQPGDRLGAYALVRELGRGGMGRIFLAERSDGHYQQQVAIKLLLGLPGPDSAALLARERQILATLAHPHIARLLDGGTTPRGQPYLVMEFIAGERIDRHCETQGLGLAARLALFAQVCDAVAEAHRHLIVHCDIKPGNVLVDAQGQARLLDFGVAQLQGQAEAGGGLTPRYASPEQQAGLPATVSSDLYSLGRLLEELLDPLPGKPREEEWAAIVDKACADQPTDRYASVGELQAELRRFGRHEALAARAGEPVYAAVKLLRRRWPWVLTGGAALALTAGFTLSLMHQRDRAAREAATTREVSQFVQSLFEGADPEKSGKRHDVTALELLDQARERLAKELQNQPEQRARLQQVLADVYEKLGRNDRSAELFALSLAGHGHAPAEEARLQARLTLTLANSGRSSEALKPAQRAHELLLAEPSPDDAAIANIENRLGIILTNLRRLDEAEPLLKSALARRRQQGELSSVGSVLHNLARLEVARDNLAAAEAYFRESLSTQQASTGPQSDLSLDTQVQFARVLADRRQYDEAIALMRDASEKREAIWGARSHHLGWTLNHLGGALFDAGRAAEAVAVHRRGLAVDEAAASGQTVSRDVAIARHNLGKALMAIGDAEAGTQLRQSVAERIQVFGRSDAPGVQPARANLIRWLLLTGQDAQAELDALWAERGSRKPADADRLLAQLLRIEAAQARRDWGAARAGLAELQAQVAALKSLNRAHWLRLRAAQADHDGQAEAALQLGSEAWATLEAALPHPHAGRLAPGLAWAARLQAGGRKGEASRLLRELAPIAAEHAPGSAWVARYRAATGA